VSCRWVSCRWLRLKHGFLRLRGDARRGRCGLRFKVLSLLVNCACEKLLRVSEDDCPGYDLSRGVQGTEARDKLSSNEQYAKERG